jgi:hypothetical protein
VSVQAKREYLQAMVMRYRHAGNVDGSRTRSVASHHFRFYKGSSDATLLERTKLIAARRARWAPEFDISPTEETRRR